jgi:hypothetical protein
MSVCAGMYGVMRSHSVLQIWVWQRLSGIVFLTQFYSNRTKDSGVLRDDRQMQCALFFIHSAQIIPAIPLRLSED